MTAKLVYLNNADYQIEVTFQSAGKPDNSAFYDYYVYAGERVILKFKSTLAAMQTIIINGIKYLTDNNGALYYDATDEVRVNMGGSFSFTNEDDEIGLRLHPINGINPENLLLPATTLEDTTGVQIVPPSVIYTHERLSELVDLTIEVRGIAGDGQWTVFIAQGGISLTAVNDNTLKILSDTPTRTWTGIQQKNVGILSYFNRLRECDNACVLKWRSASGVYRTAIWRIKKVKKTATSRELMPQGDEYLQQRGMDISFVAYIEGLNAYDYAYYADIITSGDIHCLINEGNSLDDEESRVAVSTGSYTAYDGNSGELHNLEIEVKYKHYDTI